MFGAPVTFRHRIFFLWKACWTMLTIGSLPVFGGNNWAWKALGFSICFIIWKMTTHTNRDQSASFFLTDKKNGINQGWPP